MKNGKSICLCAMLGAGIVAIHALMINKVLKMDSVCDCLCNSNTFEDL